MKLRVYHSGKPEGRQQLVDTTNEASVGIRKNWDAYNDNIQQHSDWQHAYIVTVGISWMGCNQLETSKPLQTCKMIIIKVS
jgi:hypothetical protein